jgi:6-pyruvoyltetrahydropterin/6-carboxytetrahydropterin synthase
MSFEVSVTRRFSAAHALRLPDGTLEPLHGHNWRVRWTVAAPALDATGLVIDFHLLERLADELIGPMHNRNLNDLAAFAGGKSSAECVAAHLAGHLVLPSGVNLVSVEVWETDNCRAAWVADANAKPTAQARDSD